MKVALVCLVALVCTAGSSASTKLYVAFKTPSGNIGCAYAKLVGENDLRCEIRSGMKPLPAKPKGCGDGDWGQAAIMKAKGKATRICITDTVLDPRNKVLGYGKTWKRAGFTCVSKTTGLTCRNQSGHGWFLSRAKSRVF